MKDLLVWLVMVVAVVMVVILDILLCVMLVGWSEVLIERWIVRGNIVFVMNWL